MELRRRRSVTPRRTGPHDPYAHTARRSSRQAGSSFSSSAPSSGPNTSPMSNRESHADPAKRHQTASPHHVNGTGERAAKRRRVSLSGKSAHSQGSEGSRSSATPAGHAASRSLASDEESSPVTRRRRAKRGSQGMYDEIVVRTDHLVDRTPSVAPPNIESRAKSVERRQASPAEEAHDPAPDTQAETEAAPPSNGPSAESEEQPFPAGSESPRKESQDAPVSEHQSSADFGPEAVAGGNATQDSHASFKADESSHADNPMDIDSGSQDAVQITASQVSMADDATSSTSGSQAQSLDASPTKQDHEDELGSELEDPDEDLDELSQKPDDDDADSIAESAIEDDNDVTGTSIPRITATTASPLEAISEEDEEGARTPMSAAGGDSVAAGIGKPARRLPGRRRAPHAIPRVEAALRRQLQLRVRYRAVAKQLKPILAELAKRSLKALKADKETHLKAGEHKEIQQVLDDRFQARLAHLDQDYRSKKDILTTMLEAQVESQKMRFHQRLRNVRSDMIDRLKHDFLQALRKHNCAEDEHASEDESEDIIPALYHVNVHGKRKHILSSKYESRSRKVLEVERLFDEMAERAEAADRDEPDELDPAELKPVPFTFFDPSFREAAQHDRRLAALISILLDVTEEKPKKVELSSSPGPNKAALSLQMLASASTADAPVLVKDRIPVKHSMASLLNADPPKDVTMPNATNTAGPARNLFADHYQHQIPAVASTGVAQGVSDQVTARTVQPLLPAFSEGAYQNMQQAQAVSMETNEPPRSLYNHSQQAFSHNQPGPHNTQPTSPLQHSRQFSIGSAKKNETPNGYSSPSMVRTLPAPPEPSTDRPWPSLPNAQTTMSLPSLPGDISSRHRSASDFLGRHTEQDLRRSQPESGRPMGGGVNYHDAYGSSRYDPFRRSTISSSDALRRYSPHQSSVPPLLHQRPAGSISSLAPVSSFAATPPREPYSSYRHERSPPLPRAPPPLSYSRGGARQDSTYPPRPFPPYPSASLPPPPLPPATGLPSHTSYRHTGVPPLFSSPPLAPSEPPHYRAGSSFGSRQEPQGSTQRYVVGSQKDQVPPPSYAPYRDPAAEAERRREDDRRWEEERWRADEERRAQGQAQAQARGHGHGHGHDHGLDRRGEYGRR